MQLIMTTEPYHCDSCLCISPYLSTSASVLQNVKLDTILEGVLTLAQGVTNTWLVIVALQAIVHAAGLAHLTLSASLKTVIAKRRHRRAE